MNYKHRYLSDQEKIDFMELFSENIKQNFVMKHIFLNRSLSLLFLLLIVLLGIVTIFTCENIMLTIIGIVFGVLSIQINFIVSHLWAHSLMLEYQLWNTKNMFKYVGQIPSVMFYAFYHHHHTKTDDWSKNALSFNSFDGAFMVAVSHWESFSLFTSFYPIPGILSKLFVIVSLWLFPSTMAGFIFGYEFGVILLPVSHDWVHDKKACAYGIRYFLEMLEFIGIFATQKDHIRHHVYHTPYVYQGFTSSGLYWARMDKFVDNIWNYVFDWCNNNKYPMYKTLWYIMTGIIYTTLSVSMIILVKLNTYV